MKEYNINLSTDNFANINTDIKIKQNDFNSALFLINTDIEFTSAVLKFKLPGKSVVVSENYVISNGIISYCIENSVLSEYGKVVCEVSYYNNNQRITTNTFTFEVIEEISTSYSVKADNKLQILDNLINKSENLLNTAKQISLNMPAETLSGRCVSPVESIGVKRTLKINGKIENSQLIVSDGKNMLKFLEKDYTKSNTADQYYEVIDNKVYVNNLIVDDSTPFKNNFGTYFKIEPITLYKDIPYTITTSEKKVYPYIILYTKSNKQIISVSTSTVFVPTEDVEVYYARLWSNFGTTGMSGYTYNGFYDLGIYLGEYTLNTTPENVLENKRTIAIPQTEPNSYIFADNTNAIICEGNKVTDISKTEIGKELINLTFNKDKCFMYCTNDVNIEISYYKDILKLLDKYQLKEVAPVTLTNPRPQNNIITETIPD